MKQILNFINGELVAPNSGDYFDNTTPVTGQVYSKIPDGDSSDIDLAVSSAKKAFISWSKLSKNERYNYIMRLADEIEEHFDKLVEAESKDNGKPEWLARAVDIPRSSENFRFFATAALHFDSEIHEMDGKALNYTLRQPVGVVGCISPWNLPLYLLTWKIAPALAAGNTVVAKPSEITPMTAFLLSKICQKANFPKGVLNIVHGYGYKVGDALSRHPDVPIISFTGGTETGKKIASA
ncbi:MAG: aldehyde dehydrogenase family protein, partial [Candidatus Marinimicrobia bacterium]|nr:aldehyde dehydrogenase family protein [Candidatus Neomarinimicrobiota bacterium]